MNEYSRIEKLINKNNDEFNIKQFDESFYYFIFNMLIEINKSLFLTNFKIYNNGFNREIVIKVNEYFHSIDLMHLHNDMMNGLDSDILSNNIIESIENECLKRVRR